MVIVEASMEHIVKNVVVIFSSIWWLSRKHDKHHYSHAPVVTALSIAALEHFRRDIIRSTVGHGH